ncbi:hypothetical protein U472_11250 [Orenia metallireducens]|jgi:hypothetical protein|uniref:Outer membrane protein beta-barrel domain-containing protein n=1 Tax=Orenia metallireducens TaxID=1413210 RepID=A0A1C0A8H3_9FIRM|nr:hypothetical protein [Orenia metallireducens]OCL26559.1 hypothetical protein U472_11250 [Orenia metallireducens]
MNKKLILLLAFALIIISSSTSYATFTTGTGKHTFKLETFKPDPKYDLQSFLVGFGINRQSSINLRLTDTDDSSQALNYLAPYYYQMKGSKDNTSTGTTDNNFYAVGPILEVMYQYIPTHPLFVNPDSLNALQIGLRNLRGDSKVSYEDDTASEHVNRTYLMIGLLSRSRWENYNVFSNMNLTTDLAHNSWGFDGQVGIEVIIKGNFKAEIGYKYMGTTSGSASGATIALKVDY